MKTFALNHPFITGLIIFLIIFLGGSLSGIVFGDLMIGDCKPRSPSDPCDAGATLAVSIWIMSVTASLILGVLGGISSAIVLKLKQKSATNF